MYLDPLHLCIALAPCAVYLVLLGFLNLSTRPFLTTGGRDVAALSLAVGGLVIAGPMELFFPESAVASLGVWVWPLLLTLYGFCVLFLVLFMRPRIVIYNISVEQLRPLLVELVSDLDENARWAGDTLFLPRLGVQLHVEPFVATRNTLLVASGPRQHYGGWRRLELELAAVLRTTRCSRNPFGFSLILFGLLMMTIVTFTMVDQHQTVAQSLTEMLRL
jgi:hypothetical protein